MKVYQTWQHAVQTLNKKREQKTKLELMGKNDKVPSAREDVIEVSVSCVLNSDFFLFANG